MHNQTQISQSQTNESIALRPIPTMTGYFAGSDGKIYTGRKFKINGKYSEFRDCRTKKPSPRPLSFVKNKPGRKVILYISGRRKIFGADSLVYWAFKKRRPLGCIIRHRNKQTADCTPANLFAKNRCKNNPNPLQTKRLKTLEEKFNLKYKYEFSSPLFQKYLTLKKLKKNPSVLINYIKTFL